MIGILPLQRMVDGSRPGVEGLVRHYLLYDDSLPDIAINYSLLLTATLVTSIPWPGGLSLPPLRNAALLLLLVTTQALVWYLAEAFGVSLVWCGQLGLLALTLALVLRSRPHQCAAPQVLAYSTALLLGLAGIVYYSIHFPPITTVAHLLAVLLGLLLSWSLLKGCCCQKKTS